MIERTHRRQLPYSRPPRRAGRGLRLALAAVLLIGAAAALTAAPARAAHIEDGALDNGAHYNYLETTRLRHKWLASWMKMTQQYTSNMMHQMWIVGTFFDAKHQLETQRLFQQLLNEAHKDYHPSDQMCRFGTNTRSLAASDERGRVNAQVLSTMLLNRELLAANTSAAGGISLDKRARLRQFKRTYCNIYDNNSSLAEMCRLTAQNDGEDFQRGEPDARTNKDISYVQNVDNRYTLDINFTDTTLTEDEEDIIALSKNLFAHDLFTPIPARLTGQEFNRETYLDARSVIALRGVARNSFGHIVGQRARGTEAVAPFVKMLVEELGVPQAELDHFLGEHPSYFAQMEVITRKMYQNPSFYAHLYTKPANVARTGASLQAIKLMQDRDRFESALRREMLLSAILEVKLREAQSRLGSDFQFFEPFERNLGAPGTPGTDPMGCTGGWLDCQ